MYEIRNPIHFTAQYIEFSPITFFFAILVRIFRPNSYIELSQGYSTSQRLHSFAMSSENLLARDHVRATLIGSPVLNLVRVHAARAAC